MRRHRTPMVAPIPCALCGSAHTYGWQATPEVRHPAPERAGYPETARLCDGCQDGFGYALTVSHPKMSAETLREVARIAAGFHDRVARANRRLEPTTASLYAAKGSVPSPHFRVTLNPNAPGKLLPKLLKLGATLDQVQVRP